MKKILILGTFILWYGGIFAQDKKVAVFDPDGKAGKSAKEIIREEVSNVIVNTRGYAVLERQQIDKVLAENKFQMSGQVDNAQIVAIGKKIGANAVFVTNATELHDELRMPYLYISFKLIDVQTGRVEKQKTAKTRGESDIDVVVRQVVSEMLGASAPAATSRSTSSDVLIADGMDVLYKGRELSQNEVYRLMNTGAPQQLYSKGIFRRSIGTKLVWLGAAGIALGGIYLMIGASDYGTVYAVMGCASIGAGITCRISGKYSVKKAVESYNSQLHFSSGGYTPELHFGFTQHGVGLAYKF